MTDQGSGTRGAYCRADRERQVGAGARRWPSGSAARSSMPIPCRSIATCASSRRGRRRRRRRACRTGSTAMSMRRRTIRSGAGARDVGSGAGRSPGRRARADPGRRHRALFQGADAGALGGAADAGEIRAAVRARLDARGRRGAACRARPARSGDRGAAACPATACASRARWRCWRRPGARSPTGTATACRRCSIRRARSTMFLDAGARRAATAGSTRASTPCWRPARWTR